MTTCSSPSSTLAPKQHPSRGPSKPPALPSTSSSAERRIFRAARRRHATTSQPQRRSSTSRTSRDSFLKTSMRNLSSSPREALGRQPGCAPSLRIPVLPLFNLVEAERCFCGKFDAICDEVHLRCEREPQASPGSSMRFDLAIDGVGPSGSNYRLDVSIRNPQSSAVVALAAKVPLYAVVFETHGAFHQLVKKVVALAASRMQNAPPERATWAAPSFSSYWYQVLSVSPIPWRWNPTWRTSLGPRLQRRLRWRWTRSSHNSRRMQTLPRLFLSRLRLPEAQAVYEAHTDVINLSNPGKR
eukprot:m.433121 g.433121  ORF g.433121 m.433121 type:complete len:299 (+) comp56757_c0_seq27:2462-3358(+)